MKKETKREIQAAVSGLKETIQGIKPDASGTMNTVKAGVQMVTAAVGSLAAQGEQYRKNMRKAGE
ncbi:MAG: hypothetical protein HFI15_10945 [Lachnospiraceae bacterium]|nr:hypothetical protein [Lachnospiraceae bacterium]